MPRGARTVCVVDDNRYVADTLAEYLFQGGYLSVTASTAMEAMTVAADNDAGLVITAIKIPGWHEFAPLPVVDRTSYGGFQLIQLVKLWRQDTKVVAMTAGDDRLLARAIRLGADAALRKPFSKDRVLTLMRALTSANGPAATQSLGGLAREDGAASDNLVRMPRPGPPADAQR